MQGIFDIIGPIMIGPSSSHTAGAARLGAMGRQVFGKTPAKVEFLLHGSFAKTYQGHGTDKALVAGILGYRPDDERLRNALEDAKREKIEISFTAANLGDVHPNSVEMILSDSDHQMTLRGASIGGGSIRVEKINDFTVDITGDYNSLLTIHQDRPGIVALISSELAKHQVNIAFMRLFREGKGRRALMIIETDQMVSNEVLEALEKVEDIEKVLGIPALS